MKNEDFALAGAHTVSHSHDEPGYRCVTCGAWLPDAAEGLAHVAYPDVTPDMTPLITLGAG